jgi:hypothetical protein
MPRTLYVSFANLTCRFGDDLVLLDLANEVLLPAIFNPTYRRKRGLSSFLIRNTGFLNVDVEGQEEPQLTIFGRLIKDTTLIRTQIFTEEAGLQENEGFLESAPSSFFALDINNHKLVFLPETPFAPTVAQFATTLQKFVRQEHAAYVRALYEASKNSDRPEDLLSIMRRIPPPDVKATPMASDSNVEEFVETFSKITRLEFKLLNTNAEFQRDATFRTLRALKEEVHADVTRLVHDSSEGLDKEAVTEEVKLAAAGGNQRVTLTGLGDDGARFKGSNEDFRLQVAITELPATLAERAVLLVRTYFRQVAQGRLKPDENPAKPEKLAAIRENLDGSAERN